MLETLTIRSHFAVTPIGLRKPSSRCVVGRAGSRAACRLHRRRFSRCHVHACAQTRCDLELQGASGDSISSSSSSSSGMDNEEIDLEGVAVGPGEGGRVQRYLFAVEYIGTRFSGSQWQPGRRTVAGVLQDAFLKFVGKPVSVVCSSRTDSGVHALSNVFHVDIERVSKRRPGEVLPPYDPAVVRRATNHFLQKNEGDVTITDVRCVPVDFHARTMAVERTYFYLLLTGVGPLSLFERGLAWHVRQDLDIFAMQKACNVLVGCHDFSSFRGSRCQARSPVKTLDELCVSAVEPLLFFSTNTLRGLRSSEVLQPGTILKDGQETTEVLKNNSTCSLDSLNLGQRRHHCLVIKARARSFLYHQVRLLVGVLKSVGAGDLTASDVERILHMKMITANSPIAPACGLYLSHVKYNL